MSKYYLIKDDSVGQDTTGIWVENPTGKWKVKQPIELTKKELEHIIKTVDYYEDYRRYIEKYSKEIK